ncbi:MAG: hypothetical protein R3E91_00885 [Chlamydiales bacterium]
MRQFFLSILFVNRLFASEAVVYQSLENDIQYKEEGINYISHIYIGDHTQSIQLPIFV